MSEPKRKSIVIAGIYRSGSTWMFNAVRGILEAAGIRYATINSWKLELSIVPDCWEYSITKVRGYDTLLANSADFVFTSYRSIADVRASLVRFRGEQVANSLMPTAHENWSKWRKISRYDMKYSVMVANPEIPIACIARELGLAVDCTGVVEWMKTNCVPPTDKDYDPVTLLFRNHITSGGD